MTPSIGKPIIVLILFVKSRDCLEFVMSIEFTEILVGSNVVGLIGIKFPLPVHELLLQKTAVVELDVLFAIRSVGTNGLA